MDRAVELTRSLPKLATSTGVDPSAFMGRLDRGYQGEFPSSSCCRLRCLAQQCGNRCRSRGAATSANRRNSRSGALALQSSGQRSVGGSHPTGYSLLGERIVSLLLQGSQVGRRPSRRLSSTRYGPTVGYASLPPNCWSLGGRHTVHRSPG